MLVRSKPFREWVTVYFDPAKVSEEKLLRLLRERRCPRASLDRKTDDKLTAMNPFVGPGGVVQLQVPQLPDGHAPGVDLPADWKLVGPETGVAGKDGKLYLSVQVPAKVEAKKYTLGVSVPKHRTVQTEVEVVRRVGD